MFQLTPSGSAVESIAQANAFRVCFSDPNQGTCICTVYWRESSWQPKWLLSTTALMYIPAVFIRSLLTEAPNQGIEVVAAEAFTEDSKTDFSVQLQKAKEAGAELVFLPIYYTEASIILTQANSMGYASDVLRMRRYGRYPWC